MTPRNYTPPEAILAPHGADVPPVGKGISTDAAEAVESVFTRFLGNGVVAAVWPDPTTPDLLPEEVAAIHRANTKRRDEFGRGRAAARKALSRLGVPPCPILVGPHREPLWPSGIVGSITHCDGLAAAVAAPAHLLAGLGIDAEPEKGLPPDIRSLVLSEEEFRTDPVEEMSVFCAKESIHKAVFPLSGVWMDFLDVVVHMDRDGRFTAAPAAGRGPLPREVTLLHGRTTRTCGFILAGCRVP